MVKANIGKDASGRIVVSFPYDPSIVTKIKTIEGRKWHPVEKHWSFPDTDSILKKILKVLGDKEVQEVQIDPALKGTIPDLQTDNHSIPPLEKGGEGGFESGLSPKFAFEDLRRELVSRKYSYKTIKGYLYYNKDFINHVRKNPSETNDGDINPAPFSGVFGKGAG